MEKRQEACISRCHWGTLLGFFLFQCPTPNGTEPVSFCTRENLSDLFTQQKFWLVEALGKRGREEKRWRAWVPAWVTDFRKGPGGNTYLPANNPEMASCKPAASSAVYPPVSNIPRYALHGQWVMCSPCLPIMIEDLPLIDY